MERALRQVQWGRWLAVLVTGFVLWGSLPSPGLARRGGGGRFRREFRLTPTEAGAALQMKGKARTEARPDREREKINVEVESRGLEPGTVVDAYAVNAGNSTEAVFLGQITLNRMPGRRGWVRGQIELKNWDGGVLPPGVSPVTGLTEIRVTTAGNAGETLLTGTPGRGGGNGDGGGNGGGSGGDREVRRRITLAPTSVGASFAADGEAEIERRSDGRQKFKVEVESSRLEAGTVVEIRFTHRSNAGGPFSAGTLILQDDGRDVEGEVEFKSYEPPSLPVGADPVDEISSVMVILQSTGETLLVGTF